MARHAPYPYRQENGRAWIAAVGADHAGGLPRHFAVAELESDRLLGCISLQGEGPSSSFGYWYHPDAWGRGCATEARAACLAYVRDSLRLARVVSRTDPDNLASQRVLTKLGFTRTGETPIDPPTRRGVPRLVCFELVFDAPRQDIIGPPAGKGRS